MHRSIRGRSGCDTEPSLSASGVNAVGSLCVGRHRVAINAAEGASRVALKSPHGSPHKHDTFEAHGEPLGVEEVRLTKRALGWPEDKVFYIPDEALAQFRKAVEQGRELETQWNRRVDALGAVDPKAAGTFREVLTGELPKGWEAVLPRFTPADGAMATRDAGQKAITALADVVPNLIGGSGDLDPSTRTALKGHGDFESPPV